MATPTSWYCPTDYCLRNATVCKDKQLNVSLSTMTVQLLPLAGIEALPLAVLALSQLPSGCNGVLTIAYSAGSGNVVVNGITGTLQPQGGTIYINDVNSATPSLVTTADGAGGTLQMTGLTWKPYAKECYSEKHTQVAQPTSAALGSNTQKNPKACTDYKALYIAGIALGAGLLLLGGALALRHPAAPSAPVGRAVAPQTAAALAAAAAQPASSAANAATVAAVLAALSQEHRQ